MKRRRQGTQNAGRRIVCGRVLSCRGDVGLTLLEFLQKHRFLKIGAGKDGGWGERIALGRVRVKGEVEKDRTRVLTHELEGTEITYYRAPWVEPVVPDESQLKVLWSGKHFMALHKPSGLPVMPSAAYFEHTVARVLERWWHEGKVTAELKPVPLHRLGVGTSGVLLVALTKLGRSKFSAAFRQRIVKKTYRALVSGIVEKDSLTINCPIGPVKYPMLGGGTIYAAVPGGGPGCKPSFSTAHVVHRDLDRNTTYVDVKIPTGRPHQIRIHMAYSGHPLVGDPLYMKGGLPDATPKLFDDADTDETSSGRLSREEDAAIAATGKCLRPALPRDCGYHLHAMRLSFPCVEEECRREESGDRSFIGKIPDLNGQGSAEITIDAPCPPALIPGDAPDNENGNGMESERNGKRLKSCK